MPEAIPKLVLVEGDPILGMNAIVAMKNKWAAEAEGEFQWVEACPPPRKKPGEFLNYLDGEIATSDIGGGRKVVMLRGLLNTKEFKEGLAIVITAVAPGNTLIVYDETGVIRAEGKSQSKSGWSQIKAYFAKNGVLADVPAQFMDLDKAPWGCRFGSGHARAVVEGMAKRGKKMSMQTARDSFLERSIPNWSFINAEMDKLALLVEGSNVGPDDVRNIMYTWSPSHQIYEFTEAFNSGDFNAVMDKYDELTSSKISYEQIFALCLKMLRWQLIASHLYSYGQPIPTTLDSIASKMCLTEAESNTAKLKQQKPYLFHNDKEKAKLQEKMDEGITPAMARGTSGFVKDVFTKITPVKSGKLGTLPFMRVAMTRYLLMVACVESVRLEGKDAARKTFLDTARKICWRGE